MRGKARGCASNVRNPATKSARVAYFLSAGSTAFDGSNGFVTGTICTVAMMEQQVPQVMSYQGYGFSSSFRGSCSIMG